MERILGSVDSEDNGNEPNTSSLYHRVEIVKKLEKDKNELLWLAKGMPSEAEKIGRFTTDQYLTLLQYVIENAPKK